MRKPLTLEQKEARKIYLKNNKEKTTKTQQKYYIDNKEHILSKKKQYRESNVEKIKKYQKDWCSNNRELINNYIKDKKSNNSLFKLNSSIRNLINKAIKRGGYTKKTKTRVILCCSGDDFKKYLESKFESWMTWENYGKYNGEKRYGWDIDHITPLSSANTEKELIGFNHYTNLQPLCSYINRHIKRDNII